MRKFSVLLVAALSIVALATAAPAPASTTGLDYSDTAHHVTNLKRVDAGLDKLGKNECLRRLALQQAKRMANRGELFHQDLGKVQSTCGMGWVGENVAYGYSTGAEVVKAWMHSPGHRANILKSDYRLMGIASVKRDGTWWVSQVFGAKA